MSLNGLGDFRPASRRVTRPFSLGTLEIFQPEQERLSVHATVSQATLESRPRGMLSGDYIARAVLSEIAAMTNSAMWIESVRDRRDIISAHHHFYFIVAYGEGPLEPTIERKPEAPRKGRKITFAKDGDGSPDSNA